MGANDSYKISRRDGEREKENQYSAYTTKHLLG